MLPGLTHICLHVDKLQDCVHFYRRYCQLDAVEDRSVDGEGSVYLSASGESPQPVLQLKSGGKARDWDKDDDGHFGYAVESRDAVDAIAAMAKQDDILIWEADEYLPGAYFCTVVDPNGNFVEFSHGHPMPPA